MERQKVLLGVELDGEGKEEQIAGIIACLSLVFGILLCFSLIGAPIGIPLLIYGMYKGKKIKKKN